MTTNNVGFGRTFVASVLLLLLISSGAVGFSHQVSTPDLPKVPASSEAAALTPTPVVHAVAPRSPGSTIGPRALGLFNVSFVTIPSNCTIKFYQGVYPNGAWNASVAEGSYSITAMPCGSEVFESWSATAGQVSYNETSPTTLHVSSNGTLTARYAYGYNVTFNETGLLPGTQWSLWLGKNPLAYVSTITQISVPELNGTYNYTILDFPDFATKYTGNVTLDGGAAWVDVKFTSIIYPITFQSYGLPGDTRWTVSFNATIESTIASWIGFGERNGTYKFTISPVAGYHANRTSGSVEVQGVAQTVSVTFSQNTTITAGISTQTWYVLGGLAGVGIVAAVGFVYLRGRTTVLR